MKVDIANIKLWIQVFFYLQVLLRQDIKASAVECFCNDNPTTGHLYRICQQNRCRGKVVCYSMLSGEGRDELRQGCVLPLHCYSQYGEIPVHCCTSNLCNINITVNDLEYPQNPSEAADFDIPVKEKMDVSFSDYNTLQVALIIILPLTLILTLVCLYNIHRKPTSNQESIINLKELSTSGSGVGLPLLVQSTIARETVLFECIGRGRFGVVHRAAWKGQDVAVKIFYTSEESSWLHECKIYQMNMFHHKNILNFIAADNKDVAGSTWLWLVCEYHAHGSLYDYLHVETLTEYEMFNMLLSIAEGLAHLHTEITGTQGKPAIAHRDIKTRNILVKSRTSCCIADLGIAVMQTDFTDGNHSDDSSNHRPGTTRYQPPEILCGLFDYTNFNTYRRADIYSLGLCMWEMCRRTNISAIGEKTEDYELPYFDQVDSDPSYSEMIQVVVADEKRPKLQSSWMQYPVTAMLTELMQECWYHCPMARLTALRVKKNLLAFERTWHEESKIIL